MSAYASYQHALVSWPPLPNPVEVEEALVRAASSDPLVATRAPAPVEDVPSEDDEYAKPRDGVPTAASAAAAAAAAGAVQEAAAEQGAVEAARTPKSRSRGGAFASLATAVTRVGEGGGSGGAALGGEEAGGARDEAAAGRLADAPATDPRLWEGQLGKAEPRSTVHHIATPSGAACQDYVWHSEVGLRVCHVLRLPELARERGSWLPDATRASHHFPLLVDFEFVVEDVPAIW